MVFDSNAKVDLTCPNPDCGRKWVERLGTLREGPVHCPHCGLELDTTEFEKGMKNAERQLRDLGSGLR